MRVLEVFTDYGTFRHDTAVVFERRSLAARVNRLIPVGVMLELRRFQPMDRKVASELELLEQREHRLHRVCHWAETIEFEHRLSLDLVRCLAGGRSGSKADAAGSLA